MPKTPLHYWLALHHIKGIGPIKAQQLLQIFTSLEKLFNSSYDELITHHLPNQLIKKIKSPNWHQVEQDLNWAKQCNHHIICIEDDAYPKHLKEISDPPLVLYVIGEVSILNTLQIAIVGARRPSSTGLRHAEAFAKDLATTGLVITSGLAMGIDTACHNGALAVNGKTIGVAGTGLLHHYPKSNKPLIDQLIKQNGAYVSELSLNSKAHPEHFPRRNRIIAGLSLGVLVIEAALKSGSLITAYCALEQGREVFSLPGSITHPLKKGCHALIKQGAKLVETVDDILEDLSINITKPHLNPNNQSSSTLTNKERQVLQLINYDITPMDTILLHSGLTTSEVSSILLVLELAGQIKTLPGGYIRCM